MQKLARHSKEYLVSLLILVNVFVWYVVAWEQNDKLLVYFLDIGQGDSIFIKSPSGNKMIVDGGPGKTVLQELSKVLPFHDRKIDVVVSTHPDKDHIGGLVEVLKNYDVDFEIDPNVNAETAVLGNFEVALSKKDTKRIVARRGVTVDLGGGAKFIILFPDRDVLDVETNVASIVGKLVYGEKSFLLTGDSPQSIEEYLVYLDGENLESDVLKIGHHGSRTSSATSFIETVNPRYAVIQAGKDNSYGHPHKEVIDILNSHNIEILGTYDLGTILIESDGKNLDVRSFSNK
ncbi:MAG: MBL fold metallo-hydrolase [Patescibacteria group bacterium]